MRETTFRVWSVADSTSPVRASTPPASLPFVVVGKGAVSGVVEPGTRIARTDAEWQAMWQSLSLRGAQPAVQAVGFASAEQALATDMSDAEFARAVTREDNPAALLAIAVAATP